MNVLVIRHVQYICSDVTIMCVTSIKSFLPVSAHCKLTRRHL